MVGEIVTLMPPVGVIAGRLKIVLFLITTPEDAEYTVLNSLLFSITTFEGDTPLDTITLHLYPSVTVFPETKAFVSAGFTAPDSCDHKLIPSLQPCTVLFRILSPSRPAVQPE